LDALVMTRDRLDNRRAGFSLTELVVVVGLVAIMIAIALPAIGRFIRNYRIRGAMDQVAVEIGRARMTAIGKNANPGVAFVVADNNSYRWIREVPAPGLPDYGPLRDLPMGVQFTAGVHSGFRVPFKRRPKMVVTFWNGAPSVTPSSSTVP
jgi:prepilin-type N-terminal cleavage/methylation domain-containing protein